MTEQDRWRAVVAYAGTLPGDVLVSLPAALVLSVAGRLEALPETPVEFTVADLAARFGKSRSTVRGWCEAGEFPNAQKWRGEWRVPLADALAFEQAEREVPVFTGRPANPRRQGGAVDLADWRKGA